MKRLAILALGLLALTTVSAIAAPQCELTDPAPCRPRDEESKPSEQSPSIKYIKPEDWVPRPPAPAYADVDDKHDLLGLKALFDLLDRSWLGTVDDTRYKPNSWNGVWPNMRRNNVWPYSKARSTTNEVELF